jgi:hypothetical protein
LPRHLLCLMIPIRTTRITSKCHVLELIQIPPIPIEFQSLLYAVFLPQTLCLSNKILIFLHSIFCCIHRLHPFFRENFLWLGEREREPCFLKKYVDNNNDLTSRLVQDVLLEESPVDEGYTNSWSSGAQFLLKCRWTFRYLLTYSMEQSPSWEANQ